MSNPRQPKGPQIRLVSSSVRIREDVAKALDKASYDEDRSKRAIVEDALLLYLRTKGHKLPE